MPTPLNDRTCRRYLPEDPPDEPPTEDEDGNPLPRYEPDPPDDERREGRGRWEP